MRIEIKTKGPVKDNEERLTEVKPVIAVQDDSCHWYVIPAELYDEWIRLNEDMNSDGQSNFEAAEEKFIELFSKYKTGGDLNNIQLYAKL